jgi:hypothetical protein
MGPKGLDSMLSKTNLAFHMLVCYELCRGKGKGGGRPNFQERPKV